jgi:hypothetical protein
MFQFGMSQEILLQVQLARSPELQMYIQALFAWNTYYVLRRTSRFIAKFSSDKQTRIEDLILKFWLGIDRVIIGFFHKVTIHKRNSEEFSSEIKRRAKVESDRIRSMMSFGT